MDKIENNGESPSEDADSLSYWINNRGYCYVSDGEKIVGIHVLLAIAEGADPHLVFSDETEVHHEIASRVKVDHPKNVRVVTRTEHRQLHRSDATPPSPEQILFEGDVNPASVEDRQEAPSHAD